MAPSRERSADRPATEPGSPSTFSGDRYRVRQLRVVFSPKAPSARVVLLERGRLVLGREPDAPGGLTLDDSQASRAHAALEPSDDGGWEVVDLGSRNGVFVDGVKVERAPLASGAVLRIGRSLLVYVDSELSAAARLEPETPALRGQSVAMQCLRGDLGLVAERGLPVLILGETGVGKERVAEEIHRRSGRTGRFVAVNCAAIPVELAESELFGHVAGAFTGATAKAEGLFGAAEGGTLFLDEVGELPAALQPKLLRALATQEVRPVGSPSARKADVRFIAATLRDLQAEVEGQSFRADLLSRLASWTITVPPLRARRDDVLRLAQLFLERAGGPTELSARAAEALLLYPWPYNVRQLEQVIAATAVKAAGAELVRRSHLPDEIAAMLPPDDVSFRPAAPVPLELSVARDEVPSDADLRLVLERTGGNMAQVAKFFGKERQQIYRWAARYAIDVEAYRKGDPESEPE